MKAVKPNWWQPGVIFETVKTFVVVICLALLIRAFLIQPFIVDGSSMVPNYHNNDYLLTDKLTYRFRDPKRGEVVVFRYPRNPAENYIKRVVGLPGETVEIKGDLVIIKNAANPGGITLAEDYANIGDAPTPFATDMTTTLGDDQYFVLGDNRHASSDSRFFGPLDRQYLIGRPILRLYPLTSLSVLKGAPDQLATHR